MNTKFLSLSSILFILCFNTVFSQVPGDTIKLNKYRLVVEKVLPFTPVKNQAQTGTCWAFASCSFLESEMLRTGKPETDLSEMFFVRQAYMEKARNYVRRGGTANFGPGGQAHDVFNVMRASGIYTDKAYPGLQAADTAHNHGEMDAVLRAGVEAIVKKPGGTVSTNWEKAESGILDAYLGPIPPLASEGKDPRQFLKSTGLNPDDYVELTSFSHHPFYSKFILEIPDNWSNDSYYNLPLEDLMAVLDHAINTGFTVAFDGDVSERSFMHSLGIAIIPLRSWGDKSLTERTATGKEPEEEKKISQEMRQETFENQTTTDDHLMHIVGLARDADGKKFYLTKNSWGAKSNSYKGLLYMSQSYVELKTIALIVNRKAIPAVIADKLGLK
jgi:bleomycin hydrolase